MPRILALDWDQREARYVLAAAQGSRVTVLAAGAQPIVDVSEGGAAHADVEGALRAALGHVKLGRARAIVAAPRAGLELLRFTLPPAGDAELPEMVAHQAMRESSSVTEQSRIDFLAAGAAGQPRPITAAVLSADELEGIRTICAAAGLQPDRVVVRPYATAALFQRGTVAGESACLVVNLLAQEADLSVFVDDRVVFTRTARLPDDVSADARAARLVVEINRTLAVTPLSDFGAERVERVYLFGASDDHTELVARLDDELMLPSSVLDPFQGVELADGLAPDDPGRFASLVGMVLDEARGGRQAFDFLHPRQPPRPLDRRKLAIYAGAAIAALALFFGWSIRSELAEIDQKNAALQERLDDLRTTLKKADQQKKLVAAIRAWQAADVTWLDELVDLAERMPSSRDIVLGRMSLSAARAGGGNVEFQGLVRDPSVVIRMEHALRDAHHQIRSKRVQERARGDDYTWLFETAIDVARRTPADYAQTPAPTAPSAAASPPPSPAVRASITEVRP